jgi:hypothetical protein
VILLTSVGNASGFFNYFQGKESSFSSISTSAFSSCSVNGRCFIAKQRSLKRINSFFISSFVIALFSMVQGSRFKVQRFTCAGSHLDVTRTAEGPARDGNGKAQQGKQGKGEEYFADHASPFPSVAFISRTFEFIHSRNSPFTP